MSKIIDEITLPTTEQRARLKEKLKTLPSAPGVYFHKNTYGDIIYVGKAAVLKNRVRQYFQKSHKDLKTEKLVAEIADTDWIVVDTEMDALFLESEMIKRYMPRWNILLRDDKSVTFVRIDLKSEIPTVTLTRNPADDRAEYIGPFYGKTTVEKALRTLRRIFPYYDKPYNGKKTLNTDLGLTPGIEIARTTPKEYKRNLKKLIRYLNGDRKKLLIELKRDMNRAARAGNYEDAAKLRNQYFGLEELKKKIVFSDKEFLDISSDQALKGLQRLLKLKTPPRRIEGYDISHISGENTVASMVVFTNGASDRPEYRKFKIRSSTNDDLKSMQEVITRRLKHQEWPFPDLIILDGGATQVSVIKPLLDPHHIPVIGRDKSGDHSKSAEVKIYLPDNDTITRLPDNSHIAKLIARVDEESHRFAITYHRLLQKKTLYK
jgi:excinuclease ABC subunit C